MVLFSQIKMDFILIVICIVYIWNRAMVEIFNVNAAYPHCVKKLKQKKEIWVNSIYSQTG